MDLQNRAKSIHAMNKFRCIHCKSICILNENGDHCSSGIDYYQCYCIIKKIFFINYTGIFLITKNNTLIEEEIIYKNYMIKNDVSLKEISIFETYFDKSLTAYQDLSHIITLPYNKILINSDYNNLEELIQKTHKLKILQ